MTVQVAVYSDYVCPYCMLSEPIIERAAAGRDVEMDWRPFELRPEPTPTLRPEDDYLPRVWANSVYPMAERLGVPIVLPEVSPQPYTHTAFEGLRYAAEHNAAPAYNTAVFRAFFQQQRDIGRIDVLAEIAADIGMDTNDFKAALIDRRYQQAHQRALKHAIDEVHVRAVPTILIGDHRIEGVPDPDQLAAAIDEATITEA